MQFKMYLLFNPVSDDNAKDVKREFNGHELATGFVLSGLGSPDWHNCIEHPCAPTIDETGADHPNMVLSRSLKGSTNDGPTSAESNCLDTAIAVTEPATNEAAYESTEVVDRDNAALEEGVIDDRGTCFRVGMTEFHGGVVVVYGTIDTTHHTLIISEEENGKTSNTIDGDEKATLLQLVNDIGPRNDIHGSGYSERSDVDRMITDDIRELVPCLALEKQGSEQSPEDWV